MNKPNQPTCSLAVQTSAYRPLAVSGRITHPFVQQAHIGDGLFRSWVVIRMLQLITQIPQASLKPQVGINQIRGWHAHRFQLFELIEVCRVHFNSPPPRCLICFCLNALVDIACKIKHATRRQPKRFEADFFLAFSPLIVSSIFRACDPNRDQNRSNRTYCLNPGRTGVSAEEKKHSHSRKRAEQAPKEQAAPGNSDWNNLIKKRVVGHLKFRLFLGSSLQAPCLYVQREAAA